MTCVLRKKAGVTTVRCVDKRYMLTARRQSTNSTFLVTRRDSRHRHLEYIAAASLANDDVTIYAATSMPALPATGENQKSSRLTKRSIHHVKTCSTAKPFSF